MTPPGRGNNPLVGNVELAGRSSPIVIGRGQVLTLGQRIAAMRPRSKAAIVTDENVASHHLPATRSALAGAGVNSTCITVAAGEGSKRCAGLDPVGEGLR